MNDNYLLIKKLYSSEDISLLLDKANHKNEYYSKVGNAGRARVGKEKKIRKDVFFSLRESKEIDNIYFYKIQKIVKENFKLTLKYREKYKIGTYYSDEKGFYIPHTDTQGTKQHRKISIVICLSKIDDYEGGIFKFINLKKDFKFDIGDTIIFDSKILHGVEPVTSGKRQVLISFMWDEEGNQIRQKNNPTINNSRYLPKQIKNYNSSYKWIEEPYNSSYKWIEPYINLEQKNSVILECGSYDGKDAIYLSENYKRKVYSFEALPTLIENAKKNTRNYNVEIINVAVSNTHNKIVTFYKSDTKFPKSSSLYNKTTMTSHKVMNNPIKYNVKSISLNKWISENDLKNRVELITMDLQGAELLALKGLIPFDKSIKYIVVEADFNHIYDNCSTIKDVAIFLEKYNFYPIKINGNKFSISDIYNDKYLDDNRLLLSDCLFERKDNILIHNSQIKYDENTISNNSNNLIVNNIENFSINDLIIYKSDYNKLRIGRNRDGGYVVLDIPNINYDIFISGGISNDNSFEHHFINKYKNVFCEAFDFSIDKLPNPCEKIHFNKKFISTINDDKYTNLQFYMEKYNNIFLKLDIEGSEHKWFDYLNDTQLNNIVKWSLNFIIILILLKILKTFLK